MAGGTRGRVAGYDLARGLAVFGMVLVNFKFVMGADEAGPSWLVRLAGLFDGRAAATFVTLAGVGVSLLSRRAREEGDLAALAETRLKLLKRAGFLLGLGLLDTFLWPGDILHFYAFYLAAAALLLTAPDSWLWGLAGLSVGAFAAMFLLLDYGAGWDWEGLGYAGFWTPAGMVRHLFFNGFHPVFPWIAFLLVGMWLGRRDWSAPRSQGRLFWAGAGVVLAAELASWVLTGHLAGEGGEDAEWARMFVATESMPPTPLYVLAGGGTAAAVIASCLWAARRFEGSRLLEALEAAGRLALTLYAAHVLLGLGPIGWLGLDRSPSLPQAAAGALAFYAVAVLFSWGWTRRFSQGPLEAAMRRLAG